MDLIEKGCVMPEDICSQKNRETKKLFDNIEKLEIYFYFIKRRNGSTV